MVGRVVDPRAKLGGLSIIVVGNDALIEVLPARPVQFSHACRSAGFDQAVPLSWGDELVAEASLRALEQRGSGPAVLCSCPVVKQRLLGAGGDLVPLSISLASPPVAVARYLRAILGPRLRFLTFVGRCPGARKGEYDAIVSPPEFLAFLASLGIDVSAQPDYFDEVIPPDRRRYASLPGGCPTPEMLWLRGQERGVAFVEGEDFGIDLAQLLLQREPLLVDPAPTLGCSCSGVTPLTPGRSGRIAVMSMEPPRASSPVLEEQAAAVVAATLADRTPPTGIEAATTAARMESNDPRPEDASDRVPMAVTPPGALLVESIAAWQRR